LAATAIAVATVASVGATASTTGTALATAHGGPYRQRERTQHQQRDAGRGQWTPAWSRGSLRASGTTVRAGEFGNHLHGVQGAVPHEAVDSVHGFLL
jgi:hypothetical protein